ncbi:winged helix-turn-helix domain-containing protein [Desulfospira joergensenii]|uniref:winged helix-turn-helix domain-containing protein n=1 Tax=Desulfospira joergensenii TaxID=53329 RepID=UPI0003B44352|nr:LysR family transcriptional regulator [Desulfospira joergensenii]
MTTDSPFHIRSKVWIEDPDGKVIFGLGRFRILSAIDKCGSINAAARELKMGYRAIWGKIKATEEGLGRPLLVRNAGGTAGGGSQLTPLARRLLKEFTKVHSHVLSESDQFFNTVFEKKIQKEIRSAREDPPA